jgi:hypothetical protein
VVARSSGNDPGLELIHQIWPGEDPFKVNRHELVGELRRCLEKDLSHFDFRAVSDSEAIISYEMHTLPDEIQSNIGTSTLFAAWNAAVYVAQIEDERLEPAMATANYLNATERVLQKDGGLWFNDEVFVIARNDRHPG